MIRFDPMAMPNALTYWYDTHTGFQGTISKDGKIVRSSGGITHERKVRQAWSKRES